MACGGSWGPITSPVHVGLWFSQAFKCPVLVSVYYTSVSTNSSSAKFHNCWLVWWRCGVAVEDLGECKQSSTVTVSPPAAAGWRRELQCTAGKWRPLHCYSRALPAADMTTPRNTPHHGHCTGHCTDTGTLSLTMDLHTAES